MSSNLSIFGLVSSNLNKKIKYEGPIATCFKRGYSSTPKNVATAQKNATSEPFYGLAFKTQLLFFL